MADEPLYFTAPIYYANDEPHLGHTYTTVVADTLVRFWRQRGREAFFVTGTDEHGDKIARAAASAGLAPKVLADRLSAMFASTWRDLGIAPDWFVRTTDPGHVAFVRRILSEVHAKGDIFFGHYRGLYCFGCERFYQERELVDGLCPDHKIAPTEIAEENYFFRMEKYQERVLRLLESEPELVTPEGYRNEVLALLREPIGDLSISRPKSRLDWGIELPFDDRYVTYVWFDALLSYVSAIDAVGRSDLWPHVRHLIGKDILKQHTIFWLTMLMSADLPLYRRLHVHGHWLSEGQKMSKSLGNVVHPRVIAERYGFDAFRYHILREMAFGQDADFTEAGLITRLNADLANGLGNLASRVLAMQQRYFEGAVQPLAPEEPDLGLRHAFTVARRELDEHVTALAFHRGLESVWRALDHANKYVTDLAPFRLAKDPAQRPRVGAILHELLEALRVTAQLVAPVLPETARRLVGQLGLPGTTLGELDRPWGSCFPPGHRTQPPEALFPRIEATGS